MLPKLETIKFDVEAVLPIERLPANVEVAVEVRANYEEADIVIE